MNNFIKVTFLVFLLFLVTYSDKGYSQEPQPPPSVNQPEEVAPIPLENPEEDVSEDYPQVKKLNLHQVNAFLPSLYAYFSIDYESATSAQQGEFTNSNSLTPDNLSATIGSWRTSFAALKHVSELDDGIAVVFLVDISRSLKPEQFEEIKSSLKNWVDSLGAQDKAAIVTFGSDVKIVQNFSGDAFGLNEKIDGLSLTDNNSLVYQGIAEAVQLAKTIDDSLPQRRAVITLTDGIDDNVGGLTKEELIEELSVDPIPLYSIGYYRLPKTSAKDEGVKQLGILSRRSGGKYFSALDKAFEEIYLEVRSHINNQWKLELSCEECVADGQIYRFQLTATVAQENGSQRQFTDGMDIRLIPSISVEPEQVDESLPEAVDDTQPASPPDFLEQYGLMIGAGVGIFLVLLLIIKRRSRSPESSEEVVEGDVVLSEGEESTSSVGDSFVPRDEEVAETLSIRLTIYNMSTQEESELNITGQATIGRKQSSELPINDDEVSGNHCLLIFNAENNHVYIRDLDSTNGTSVNGVPVDSEYRLSEGDLITVGRTDLKLLRVSF